MKTDAPNIEPRKAYTAPKLITYGSVAELTKGRGKSVQDGNGFSQPT